MQRKILFNNMRHVLFLVNVLVQCHVSARKYQKSTSECRFKNNIYKSVKVRSKIDCASLCSREICSRFIYDGSTNMCDLHSDDGTLSDAIETPPGKSLFLPTHKGCNVSGYDFVESHKLCIKFYGDPYTWDEGRTLCQQDGGDFLTLDKMEKWNFIYQHIHSCPRERIWLGLINGTWINGVPFQDVYGVTTGFDSFTCGRIKLNGVNVLSDKECSKSSRVLCEIEIT